MFRFESPIYLWLLLLIPLLATVYYMSLCNYKKRIKKFGTPELIKRFSSTVSHKRILIKFILSEVILTLLVIMLARPQVGNRIASKKTKKGIETIIALDISNSMLAQDVPPSRLEKSKLMVENLMTKFSEDKIGLIVFAGDAFVQLPITSDYISAKMFLDNISPSLIGTQGTDIGKALNLAIHSFTPNSKIGKAIIVITDGEDNEGGAEEMANEAEKKGIKVFILGVGSKEGTTIPMPNGESLKTPRGEIVKTRLNEKMCKKIAEVGHGVYIHVDNTDLADVILNRELSKLQRGEINNVIYSDFDEQFQGIALIVILLLLLDSLILEGKK